MVLQNIPFLVYPLGGQSSLFLPVSSGRPESGIVLAMKSTLLLVIACLLFAPTGSFADLAITGPVSAKVIKVYDGDTFTVEAYPWPGLEAKVSVRIDGVDTPEIRGKCDAEKQKAIEAREFVKGLVLGETVFLKNVKHGKYAGRVVADVKLEGGGSLAQKIIDRGLGREYHGGRREGWCATL